MTATSTPLGGLPTDVPLVLLPVRLEAHFRRVGAATELLVRIYPDEVHVDSHEVRLTASEIEWGQHFWTETWLTGDDTPGTRAAWSQLVDRFGAPRAAYIADALTPSNLNKRPPKSSDSPLFPTLTPRTEGWPRAPYTRVLPDYWIAIGYAGGRRFTFTGPAIPGTLAVGPTLDATTGALDAETLVNDPNAGWLVDFPAAERAGMALRIPFESPFGTPLDRLMVLGVKAGVTAADGETLLQELLQAHRYADGLGFVMQGTPSNNTADSTSGYSSLEAGYVPELLVDPVDAAFEPGDGSNRDIATRAFGLDVAAFARVDHASAPEQREAYHMNVALWQATWGYFLEQLLAAPESPSAEAIRLGREHFSNYVRARGPVPALRLGRQPYGVVPAISLDNWTAVEAGPIDAPLVHAIKGLREVWRRSLAAIPRIPRRTDRAGELVKIAAMLPTCDSFATRALRPLAALDQTDDDGPIGSQALRELAQTIGITWFPRQLRSVFSTTAPVARISGPLVLRPAPETLSESEPLAANYLASIAGATWDALRRDDIATRADVVLYVLMRHAALLEYHAASFRILLRRGLVTAGARREPDIYDAQTRTPWMQLATVVSGLTPGAVGAYLDSIKAQLQAEAPTRDVASAGAIWRRDLYDVAAGGPVPADLVDDLRDFSAFVRSANYLAQRPTASLGRLVSETVDLASHRLDAWATSFATKRLEWMRQRKPRGLTIGGYGYLEDITPVARTPVTSLPPVPPGEDPPELQGTVFQASGNQGYVQAPSLAHATTAAILRSGYLSRKAAGDGDVLAVNLVSSRVRTALSLLEGVREGQSLGALLGYRFERGLHEHHPGLTLDRYIPSFRALAPQRGDLPTPAQPAGAVESISARNVVDGLELLARYRTGRRAVPPAWTAATIPFGGTVPPLSLTLPPATPANAEFKAIDAELRALDDAVDATVDLTIAEAVHQIAQGNVVRAGAALEAIALGDALPPDVQVVDTPRTGIALTHRLVVLFSGAPPATWPAASPRSAAEPFLEAWSAQLLGPGAADARCRVTYVSPATGAPLLDGQGEPYGLDVMLRQLGLGALDIVYLATSTADVQGSELEQRVAMLALRPPAQGGVRPADVPETAAIRLSFLPQASWPALTRSVSEVLEVARKARALMTSARALSPADLALPDAPIPADADADVAPASEPATSPERLFPLSSRADDAVRVFRAASKALTDALPADETQTIAPDTARSLLLPLAAFLLPGSVPVSPVGVDERARQALHAQAVSVAGEVRARGDRLDALDRTYPAATATPAETREYHLARLREVFGQEFRVLPRFTAVDGATLGSTFANSTSLLDGKPLTAVTWLQRAARVRDGAARLDAALIYAEALGSAAMDLKVGQLPFGGSADRWVGLKSPAGGMLGGRLSIVAHAPVPIDTSRPLAGLLVDEWVEVVPSAQETTGVSFHFDRPNARAPQAILLAVPPDGRSTWDVETLEATVCETLELAKLRLVDLSVLGEVAQFLPALYVAEPSSVQTVGSDLTRLG